MRPGYLAGYQPFGRAKGSVVQVPVPPPPEAPVATPQPLQPPPVTPRLQPQPQPRPIVQQADPATLARIAALQAKISGQPARIVTAAPAQRMSVMPQMVDDDDED